MKNFQMKNFQMKIKYFLQMKQFKATSKCKKQFHFQQMKAKNLFSCHIFETHAYTRALNIYTRDRAGEGWFRDLLSRQ